MVSRRLLEPPITRQLSFEKGLDMGISRQIVVFCLVSLIMNGALAASCHAAVQAGEEATRSPEPAFERGSWTALGAVIGWVVWTSLSTILERVRVRARKEKSASRLRPMVGMFQNAAAALYLPTRHEEDLLLWFNDEGYWSPASELRWLSEWQLVGSLYCWNTGACVGTVSVDGGKNVPVATIEKVGKKTVQKFERTR